MFKVFWRALWIPKSDTVTICPEKPTGNILSVKGDGEDYEIKIYIPSKFPTVKTDSDSGKQLFKQLLNLFSKKAKQITFSDFKKLDPVLSSFSGQKEPRKFVL